MTTLDQKLDNILIVSEHVNERMRVRKSDYCSELYGSIQALSPIQQKRVEDCLNDIYGEMDTTQRIECLKKWDDRIDPVRIVIEEPTQPKPPRRTNPYRARQNQNSCWYWFILCTYILLGCSILATVEYKKCEHDCRSLYNQMVALWLSFVFGPSSIFAFGRILYYWVTRNLHR